MPRVGSDAKLTRTTGLCPKTSQYDNSAGPSHWPIDGSMLVQLLQRWYNIDPSMVEFLLFAGNSATGTVKAAFFTIILFYRISLFI